MQPPAGCQVGLPASLMCTQASLGDRQVRRHATATWLPRGPASKHDVHVGVAWQKASVAWRKAQGARALVSPSANHTRGAIRQPHQRRHRPAPPKAPAANHTKDTILAEDSPDLPGCLSASAPGCLLACAPACRPCPAAAAPGRPGEPPPPPSPAGACVQGLWLMYVHVWFGAAVDRPTGMSRLPL
eukprot:355081-Chlamydomonas_euryale.AAC.6